MSECGYSVGDTVTIESTPNWWGRFRLALAKVMIWRLPYSIERGKYVVTEVESGGEVLAPRSHD